MKYLKFIFQFSAAVIIALSTINTKTESVLPDLSMNRTSIIEVPEGIYSYVRVLIDGVWWIYVYDNDGKLVNRYIEEQDWFNESQGRICTF